MVNHIMVNRIGFATGALLLALASTLGARAEFHLGSSGPNTWKRFVASKRILVQDESGKVRRDSTANSPEEIGGGVYTVVDADGSLLRQSRVDALEELGGGTHLPEYNYRSPDRPSMEGGELRAVRIDPTVNLALFENLIARGGSIYHGHNTGRFPDQVIRWTIDGDPTTTRLVLLKWNPLEIDPRISEQFLGAYASALILNLGIELPINRVRIYPRLGRQDDAAVIAAMAEPKPDPERFRETSFADNYLEWYEIAVADNQALIVEHIGDGRPGLRGFKGFSETTGYVDSSATDPNLEALIQTRENLDPVIDLRFPVRHERFVSIRPYIPERTWEIAEIEVYGEGYVRRSVYRSQILDFGHLVGWSKIRWKSEQPPGTQILVRTRTGNTPVPDLFQQRRRNGRWQPIDFAAYSKNFPSRDLKRIEDVDNWSFWSSTYDFAAGERDSNLPPFAWTDGVQLLSPAPSRYLQLEIVLLATLDQTPRLDELSLLFAEAPAATEVIGEIWPIEVDDFEPHSFTYVVKPILREGDRGFDRLEIFTNGPAAGVRSVLVGGEEILDRFPAEIQEDRIVISFDRLEDPKQDNEKRIEVEFSARVFRFGAEFSGWVYDSQEPDLKQSIKPGNATVRFVGNVLSVRTPTGGDLLQRLEIQPRTFTPNGDGVNDEAAISFDLRHLTDKRPVEVRIWTLDGRPVRRFAPALLASGHPPPYRWNGRDDDGRLVPPGSYLLRASAATDRGTDTATRVVSVVY